MMEKTHPSETIDQLKDDLLPEYNFDYRKARPNRFALNQDHLVVTIDPGITNSHQQTVSDC